MNITDYYSDSIIGDIIRIFKEVEMEITVTRVNVEETKFGVKKVLYATDGNKYRIGARQKFYDDVQDPGIYSVSMGEFNGKPFVKWLEYKGPLPSDNKFVPKKDALPVAPGPNASFADKMHFEQKKQDDIRLEFYTGIAKDLAIANKQGNLPIDPLDVQHMAMKMVKTHMEILEMLDQESKSLEVEKAEPAKDKQIEVEKPAAEGYDPETDEPPF